MPNLHLIMVTQVIIIQLKYLDLSVTYMHMHMHIHRYTCSLSPSMIQDICRCNLQVVVLSPLAT